jgi:3-hydroxybutyryl-CoA dehydrogenase
MGHGIAYVAARAGFEVCLHDAQGGALDRAMQRIEETAAEGVKRQKLTDAERTALLSRLKVDRDLTQAVARADLVVEAIVETLAEKQRLFSAVEQHVSDKTVLATNTSSLSVGAIAAATRRPQRIIGMHFFNPVHVMKLVEVVTHTRTDAAVRDAAVQVARRMGKEPIVVKDSPGFASSRLGVLLGLEAMRMLEAGVATAEDIDKAMELGYNHPMGPLRLTDLVGLDVRLAIAEYLHRELKGAQYQPPQILKDKVARGELGKKSGKGFYDWSH